MQSNEACARRLGVREDSVILVFLSWIEKLDAKLDARRGATPF